MGKRTHKRLYVLTAIAFLAIACIFAYWESSPAHLNRFPKRSQPLAPAGVAEQQMLHGEFTPDIPAEQRQIVAAELHATDQSPVNPPVETPLQLRPGEQHIAITQPLGTTVEDTQPTLTWDAKIDGWSYQVRVEELNSHQTVATSPMLDEAMWRIADPLLRGRNYVWRVEARPVGIRTSATAVTSSLAQFAVLSDEGEEKIQSARAHNASHLLLGSLYTHYEMWRDAVLEYRKMADEVPDSPEAMKLLRNAEIRASSKMNVTAR